MKNFIVSKQLLMVLIFSFILLFTISANSSSLPSEPDNAALLYYQALLIQPESNYMLINEVLSGTEPNEAVKKYLQSCDQTIKLAESASKISQCNWGVQSTQPVNIFSHLYHLSRLLSVNAIVLASEGKNKEALEECITVQRLANHIDNYNTMVAHILSFQTHNRSFVCIRRILGLTSPDVETLTWLQAQLSMQNRNISISEVLEENDCDRAIEQLKINPKPIHAWKVQVSIILGLPYDENLTIDMLPGQIEDFQETKKLLSMSKEELQDALSKKTGRTVNMSDKEFKDFREPFSYTEETKKKIQELLAKSDEQLLEHARQSYNKFLYPVIRIIESELPYNQKINEIQRIDDQMNQNSFNTAILISLMSNSNFVDIYKMQVRYNAHFNIMKSALEIYLIKVQTGKLPEKLPDYLPKDPMNGQDFIYQLISDGFVLKSSVDLDTKNNVHLELKVSEKK